MIDIIIPFYIIDKDAIIKCFQGLENQTIINKCNVCLISDDSPDTEYVFKLFNSSEKFKPQCLRLPQNSGPGAARNYGIDNTCNPFIYCHDADDWLYKTTTLENLYTTIIDIPECVMVEGKEWISASECLDDMGHNKIYRRNFIEKNHIRYGPLWTHEDLYFEQCLLTAQGYNSIKTDIDGYWYNSKNITPYILNQTNITFYWVDICLYLQALEYKNDKRKLDFLSTFFMWETDREIDYQELVLNDYFIFTILMENQETCDDIAFICKEHSDKDIIKWLKQQYEEENYNLMFHGSKFSESKKEFLLNMRERILFHPHYQTLSLSVRNKILSYIPQKYLF